jgi:hypothetical protein
MSSMKRGEISTLTNDENPMKKYEAKRVNKDFPGV